MILRIFYLQPTNKLDQEGKKKGRLQREGDRAKGFDHTSHRVKGGQ